MTESPTPQDSGAPAADAAPATGRLFRSATAPADLAPEAIVPLRRTAPEPPLKPAELSDVADAEPSAAASPQRQEAFDEVAAYAFGSAATRTVDAPAEPIAAAAEPTHTGRSSATGLSARGIWVVVVTVTVIMGFADAVLRGGTLGWLTGLGLLTSSIYAAAAARPADMRWAVVVPPLALAITAVTAGQLTLPTGTSLLLREAFMLLGTLTTTAPWTIGSVVATLVIVLVRRRRARAA